MTTVKDPKNSSKVKVFRPKARGNIQQFEFGNDYLAE